MTSDVCQNWDLQGFYDLCAQNDNIYLTAECSDRDIEMHSEIVFLGKLRRQDGVVVFICSHHIVQPILSMKCYLQNFKSSFARCDAYVSEIEHLTLEPDTYDEMFDGKMQKHGAKGVAVSKVMFSLHQPACKPTIENAMVVLHRINWFAKNGHQLNKTRSE